MHDKRLCLSRDLNRLNKDLYEDCIKDSFFLGRREASFLTIPLVLESDQLIGQKVGMDSRRSTTGGDRTRRMSPQDHRYPPVYPPGGVFIIK